MTLSDLCDYIQIWCHRGFAQDEVIVKTEDGHEAKLEDIKIERDNGTAKITFEGERL